MGFKTQSNKWFNRFFDDKVVMNHGLYSSAQAKLAFSLALKTFVILKSVADFLTTVSPEVGQINLTLSPLGLLISMTISASMFLWLLTVKVKSAEYPPLEKDLRFDASFSAVMSKAFPVTILTFSSLGVWLIESSPMNSREPSALSVLNTLTVPLGRGIPSPLTCVLRN